jgi:hypothetical protein
MKLKKGDWIAFHPEGEFIPGVKVMGKVVGFAEDIRRIWPDEYCDLSDNDECYLVRRNIKDMGVIRHYVLFPREVMEKAN